MPLKEGRSKLDWSALAVAAMGLVVGAACRTSGPLAGAEARPATGTVSGRVAGPEGVAPLAGCLVEAVALSSGAVFSALTSEVGLFSLQLPPGRYRVRISPGARHDVVRSPGILRVDPGELVTGADFVLGGAGLVSKGSAL